MSFAAINPSSNVAITSSRKRRSAGPFRIQFGADWENNGIMEWHRSHGPRPTKIVTLQLRKERAEPFTHQYIVLILSSDCILRLDRRADEDNPMDAVTSDGSESVDTIADVNSLSDLDKTSDPMAEVHCQGSEVDLLNIIKICFGIHRDDKARRYTLQRFNCYFFSWTILVATARHAVPWETLPFDSPWETLSDTLADALSTKSADALINMVADAAVIAVMTMLPNLKRLLSRAVSRRARLAWAMPKRLIRLALRIMLRTSVRKKIHAILQSKMQPALLSALRSTLHSVLADLRASTLRTTLWKDDVGDAMRDAARRDVVTSILDATSRALPTITITMEDVNVLHSLVVAFAGRAAFEGPRGDWRAPIMAGFNALMQASPCFADHGVDGPITDDTRWDEAWNSIRDTIQEAADAAVQDVEGKWGALWGGVMGEWVVAWEVTRPIMRETARDTINTMSSLANDALAYSVVNTLPDTHLRIAVRNMVPSRLRRVFKSKSIAGLADVTHSELQQYMVKLIREHSRVMGRYRLDSPAQVENDMREAMDRVWRAVIELDGETNANENHNADVL